MKAKLWLLPFIGSVIGANWAVSRFGVVAVAPGLVAPAGVWFAGVSFTTRDMLRESSGRRWAFAAIAVGAVVSAFIEGAPRFALASGVSFALSESADALVYEPLRKRWLTAVAVSNVVGFVVDSALFLWLAFGSFQFLPGQIVGKAWMTAAAVLSLWIWRRARRGGRSTP